MRSNEHQGGRQRSLWGFQRRLTGGGSPAADLERWWVHSLGREGARQACSHLGQGYWYCRNRAQGSTNTKLCASKSKNTHSLFFSFPLGPFSSHPPSYFLPSLIILSGKPWTHLLIPPGNLLAAGWVKLLLDSLLFRYRLAAAPKAPCPPRLSPCKYQLTGVSNAGLD